MIAYKAVREINNVFFSPCAPIEARREYRLNVTTTRHVDCGPLVAFDTYENAKKHYPELIILECESELSNDVMPDKICLWTQNLVYSMPKSDFAVGAVFCESITPIRLAINQGV